MWSVITLLDRVALSRLPHILVFLDVLQTQEPHRAIPSHSFKKHLLSPPGCWAPFRHLKSMAKKRAMDTFLSSWHFSALSISNDLTKP